MRGRFFIAIVIIVLIAAAALTVKYIIGTKNEELTAASGDKGAPSLFVLYNDAKELEAAGAYVDALALYKDLLEKSEEEEFSDQLKRDIMDLNVKIITSDIMTEDSTLYTVEKGDTLGKIASKFNTTVELIMKSNNLESDLIKIGEKLKVTTATYRLLVNCSDNTLTLKSGDKVLKVYKVSTGINGSTPTGSFKIINKLEDPVWYKAEAIVPSDSPENILGSRWMGLSIPRYGIHGTTDPGTIGEYVTAGCVRMSEPDIQELYAILPVGTEVVIVK